LDHHSAHKIFLQAQSSFSGGDTTILIVVCILLMIVSAIVSGAQVAFFSLDNKDLNMLKAREDVNARLVPGFLERPRLFMVMLVITATISNISIIFILNYLLELLVNTEKHLVFSVFLKVVIISLVLLLSCEILPKIYAMHNKIRMALFAAPLVQGILNVLEPLGVLSVEVSDWLSDKVFGRTRVSFSADDINEAIELSVNQSASQEERNMLRSIIHFGQITAKQIMRTRLDVSGIDYNLSFSALLEQVGELHYSRLPVYKENLDNIAGMIHSKDLLPHLDRKDDFDWHEIIRQPYYVHEHKLIEDLLKEFQSHRMHFAIVVDEFGGTSGIVTLEDIMEEIIGDIKDEFDEEEFYYKQLDERHFIFEGKTMLNDVCRILNIPADTFEKVKGESDSLGGLILEIAGAFPETDQVIRYDSFEFAILEISKMRIQRVKIAVLQKDTE
jgi:gliding motility-associated protein GldE